MTPFRALDLGCEGGRPGAGTQRLRLDPLRANLQTFFAAALKGLGERAGALDVAVLSVERPVRAQGTQPTAVTLIILMVRRIATGPPGRR
jgi:hypothetical protein